MGINDISDAIDLHTPAPEQNQQKTNAGEQTVEQTERSLDEKPNGGYGWICVLCLLSINAMTWGVNTTYGVFMSYYLENNYYRATRMQYAWVGGLSVATCDSAGPLANFLVRRTNHQVPMLIGAALVMLGQCTAAVCKSFPPFIVCQGFVFGLGMGLVLVPSYPILAYWFDKRLALAQGISNGGSGVGALILSNTTVLLLQRLGVKWTLIINGCVSGFVLIVATSLLRARKGSMKPKNRSLQLKLAIHPGYRWVLTWAAFVMMAYFIAIYTIASYATDGIGLSQSQGGAIQSLLAAGQIIGRPLWGQALDKGGRINMVIVSYIICGIATFAIWFSARSFGVLALYAIIQGMTGGTVVSTSTPIAASVLGEENIGSALSIYWLAMVVPSLVAQPLAILLVDYSLHTLARKGTNAYTLSIILCGSFIFTGCIVLYGAKRHLQSNWKVFRKV